MVGYTVPGRKSAAAYDNLGMQMESWLLDKRKWPCSNPKCGKKVVDPDDPFQYCSKACFNAVLTNKNGASGRSHYDVAMEKVAGFQSSKYWRNLQHGQSQRFSGPPVLTANAPVMKPILPVAFKSRVSRFTFDGLKQPKGKGRRL